MSPKLCRSTHKRSTGYYMLSNSFHFRPYRSSVAFRQSYRSSNRTAHRTKKICVPGPAIYIYIYIYIYRPPLWSSGQSFWLQIQRSRVRFPALPDFLCSSGSGTGPTQPREVKLRSYLNKKVAAPGSENRD